ncbi:hypothetical protein GTZ97_12355 [Aquabacterium fontiphilum]|uniref:hypothetical protein n=1 Tax=Aquabacterium fontiphilum TaxID=450365 RepID=UPI00137870D1|nr:hypothetical protein [Aquabacterium fontiphilum]NBD21456.1 hypothetical protein [Aquabacterium fontiphilum]
MQAFYKIIAFSASCAILSGCAFVDAPVPAEARQENGSAYISGRFTRNDTTENFALILKNTVTGKEYLMPLGDTKTKDPQLHNKVIALKVEPGLYSATHWVTYFGRTKEQTSKNPVNSGDLKMIHAFAGENTFIGDYDLKYWQSPHPTQWRSFYLNWSMRAKPITLDEARRAFEEEYPNLSTKEFHCLICTP